MILFNGSSGSLGAYFGPALADRGQRGFALRSRLECRDELNTELAAVASHATPGSRLTFVQLAAKVSVPACEQDPDAAYQTNVVDTVETVRSVCAWGSERGCKVTVIYVSSGHVYAARPAGAAIAEADPTAPRSVYARTKLQAERALQDLARDAGVQCVIARVFGLIAPCQPAHYVLPGLIQRVVAERVDAIPGLSFVRDYVDSRDVCEILLDIAMQETLPSGIVNVCSGKPVTLRELVELIAHAVKPNDAERLLRSVAEAPARPDDIPWIVGSTARLVSILGREPLRISREQTVRDAVSVLRS
jgi:nucleoside-diphosphate-sugar epimerase